MPLIIRSHIVYPAATPKLVPVKIRKPRAGSTYRFWAAMDDETLRQCMSGADCRARGIEKAAAALGRSVKSTWMRAVRLGLDIRGAENVAA
jgi:hypothetical protein